MTDFRALCAELNFIWSRSTNPDDLFENMLPLVDRARAALAEQPVAPTDDLSPAAQSVLDAATVPTGDFCLENVNEIAAAALRAAADQVVPDESHPEESQFWDDEAEQEWQNNRHVRLQFLAIAAELEGSN